MERVGDLEVDQDLGFERREWRVERVGLVVLVGVVAAAVAGLFGGGPLSSAGATAPDGSIEVDYQRFGRRGAGTDVVVSATAEAAVDGRWQVEVSRGFLDGYDVELVTPRPDAVEAAGDVVRFTFAQPEPGAALEVAFSLQPQVLWRRSGEVGLVGRDRAHISQFLFP